jgi:hypothetical protein
VWHGPAATTIARAVIANVKRWCLEVEKSFKQYTH